MERLDGAGHPEWDHPLFDRCADELGLQPVDTVDELVSEVVREARDHTTVYIRYSEGPVADRANGPSRDYEAGFVLPGLSVATLTPEPWWPDEIRTWVVRRACKYRELDVAGRFAWILTGREVARGPDHEPVLRAVRPLARLTDELLTRAEAEYRRRLAAGRDSRGGSR